MSSPSPVPESSAKGLVLYDGQCHFCQKSVALLKKLDWLKALAYQDGRDAARLPATSPPLDSAQLLEEMHLVPRSGQPIYRGFRAFRWMAWRLPVFWLLAPFLYLPGVPWLGNKAYLWVARHRYQLVPCKDGVCEIPSGSPQQKP